jgi:hypothetical protein
MRKTYLIMALGVIVSFGLGFGLGAILNALSFLGPTRIVTVTQTLSARERFLACSVSEVVPTAEETMAMLARRQGRYAEPHWGTP